MKLEVVTVHEMNGTKSRSLAVTRVDLLDHAVIKINRKPKHNVDHYKLNNSATTNASKIPSMAMLAFTRF